MPEVEEEHQRDVDESAESEHQQEERINDPLTQTGTGAPKVAWQTTPSEGGDGS